VNTWATIGFSDRTLHSVMVYTFRTLLGVSTVPDLVAGFALMSSFDTSHHYTHRFAVRMRVRIPPPQSCKLYSVARREPGCLGGRGLNWVTLSLGCTNTVTCCWAQGWRTCCTKIDAKSKGVKNRPNLAESCKKGCLRLKMFRFANDEGGDNDTDRLFLFPFLFHRYFSC
jgi:hypothetical protein